MTPLPEAPPGGDPPFFSAAISGTRTAAIIPGTMTIKGTNIFGKEPMIGVLRAADMDSEAMAR